MPKEELGLILELVEAGVVEELTGFIDNESEKIINKISNPRLKRIGAVLYEEVKDYFESDVVPEILNYRFRIAQYLSSAPLFIRNTLLEK